MFGTAFASGAFVKHQWPRVSGSRVAVAAVCLQIVAATPAHAEPFGWPQLGELGTPVVLNYSFVNLLDPAFQGIPVPDLTAATTQAFELWSNYAPLHFVERADSGPAPSDIDYAPDGHPEIRIGAHRTENGLILAHAFLPVATDLSGLAGDIHFNSDSILSWGIEDGFPAIDFLEVMIHEIGHSLGLSHIDDVEAIMNSFHGFRFRRGEPAFLLPADIAALQGIYGAGTGSVAPIPEPSTMMLVSGGLLALFLGCARRNSRGQIPRGIRRPAASRTSPGVMPAARRSRIPTS